MSYNTRRSGGKRLRMDQSGYDDGYGDNFSEQSNSNFSDFGQGGMNGGFKLTPKHLIFYQTFVENTDSYDPMAYYRQQQQEMLLQASEHVQASQQEIQQAQQIAQLQEQHTQSTSEEGGGRRRSRAAAAQAKQALSMLNDNDEDGPRYGSPAIAAAAASPMPTRGRGRGRGRGRPPGTTAAVMAARRRGVGDYDRPGRRPGRQVRTTDIVPEDESSLYFIIRNGKVSLQQVVDDWIDSYKVNNKHFGPLTFAIISNHYYFVA